MMTVMAVLSSTHDDCDYCDGTGINDDCDDQSIQDDSHDGHAYSGCDNFWL